MVRGYSYLSLLSVSLFSLTLSLFLSLLSLSLLSLFSLSLSSLLFIPMNDTKLLGKALYAVGSMVRGYPTPYNLHPV